MMSAWLKTTGSVPTRHCLRGFPDHWQVRFPNFTTRMHVRPRWPWLAGIKQQLRTLPHTPAVHPYPPGAPSVYSR